MNKLLYIPDYTAFIVEMMAKNSMITLDYLLVKSFISDGQGEPKDINFTKMPNLFMKKGDQRLGACVANGDLEYLLNNMTTIQAIADCDNNPNSDYTWEIDGEAKARAFMGDAFFDGVGVLGDEDYQAPRKKIAVLAV